MVGERYDREEKAKLALRVTAHDGGTGRTTIEVMVELEDLAEPPVAPAAPAVTAPEPTRQPASWTELELAWQAPDNTGRPAIAGYDVRWRAGSGGAWTDGPQDLTETAARLAGLDPDTEYQVEVRAKNADGPGPWSPAGTGRTNERPPPAARFAAAEYTAVEGFPGVVVTVELDPSPLAAVTVPLTVALQGGATAADYEGVPRSLAFEAGQTSATFTVTALPDEDNDPGESIEVGFGRLPAGIVAGEPATTVVALAPEVRVSTWYVYFDKAAYTASEGGNDATVTVRLNAPWKPERDESLTVVLSTAELRGGATAADFSGLPGSVAFGPGQTAASFTVTATERRRGRRRREHPLRHRAARRTTTTGPGPSGSASPPPARPPRSSRT